MLLIVDHAVLPRSPVGQAAADDRRSPHRLARVPPKEAWKRPGLPQDWCPLLECDPNEPDRAPLAGWVYLWMDDRVREVDSRALEIVKGSERPT